jgi:predicted MFS family arabinose efflux permease
MTAAERRVALILVAVQFTHMVDFVLMMPLSPLLKRDLGLNAAGFGQVVAAYTMGAALSGSVAAFVLDALPRRAALLVAYAVFTLGNLACGLAGGYGSLLVARAVAGAAAGVLGALVLAIIADAVSPQRRGRVTGQVMSSFALASVLGVPLGAWLGVAAGWRSPFLVLAAMGLPILLLAAWGLPRDLPAARPLQSPLWTLRALLGPPAHRRILVFISVFMAAGFTVIPYIPSYLVGNVGLTPGQVPLMYLCGGAVATLTTPLAGRWSDRFGAWPTFAGIALVSTLIIQTLTVLPPVPVWAALSCTTLFIVLVNGRYTPAMALVGQRVDVQVRAGFMALMGAVQAGAMSVSALVAGAMLGGAGGHHDDSSALAPLDGYGAVGVLAVCCTLLAIVIGRPLGLRPAGGSPATAAVDASLGTTASVTTPVVADGAAGKIGASVQPADGGDASPSR